MEFTEELRALPVEDREDFHRRQGRKSGKAGRFGGPLVSGEAAFFEDLFRGAELPCDGSANPSKQPRSCLHGDYLRTPVGRQSAWSPKRSGAPPGALALPIGGTGPDYFLARAVSIADVRSAESGATPESKRFSTDPSRPIRNFPKFHFTSPGNAALGPVNAA